MVVIQAAFAEVNGGISATGTLTVINEVEASQVSSTILAVQFSSSPLGLGTPKEQSLMINFFQFLAPLPTITVNTALKKKKNVDILSLFTRVTLTW